MLGMPVLYCRGGGQSKELAEKLARDGVPVAFLEGGLLGWEAAGLPSRASGLTSGPRPGGSALAHEVGRQRLGDHDAHRHAVGARRA